jgi:hypothetical protein
MSSILGASRRAGNFAGEIGLLSGGRSLVDGIASG